MPRLPRLHVHGGCYHVVLRGNHREALFSNDADRRALNDIVADVTARLDARVHAFCWMSNHLHALLQVAGHPLGGIMQRIAMRYSRHRHKVLQTTGHLFERRYRARLVETDAYFLAVLRYIHLNPVIAHIVTDPAHYPWSSHRIYLGTDSLTWITTEFGLSLFCADRHEARRSYARLICEGQEGNDDLSLADPENGRTDLCGALLATAPTVISYKPRSSVTLQELGDRICREHHITLDRMRSLSRARELTPIRVEFITRAIDLRIATLSELARFLHRDPSALTKLLARQECQSIHS